MADESQYLQVLLFLALKEEDRDSAPVEEGPAGPQPPPHRGEFIAYALLPRIPRYDALSKLFGQNGIIVLTTIESLSGSLLNSLRSGRVELIEMCVRVGHHDLVDAAGRLIVSTDRFNWDIIPVLLPRHILDKSLHRGIFPSDTRLPLDDEVNLEILKKLVAAGPDIEYRHEKGGTFLHFAVRKEYPELVALLVESGAKVDAKMNRGNTPLNLAFDTYIPSMKIINSLLESGANVNSVGENDVTPFHRAITMLGHSCPNIVQVFLDKGGDVNSAAPIGSVLEMAAKAGPHCLSHVLKFKPDLERNKRAFREILKRRGAYHSEAVKQILDYGFELCPEDAADVEFLDAVVCLKDSKMFEDLLRWGAFVYRSRTSPAPTVESSDPMRDLLSRAVSSENPAAIERIFKIDHVLDYSLYSFTLNKAISTSWDPMFMKRVLQVGDLRLNCFFEEEVRDKIIRRGDICRHIVKIATADLRVNEDFLLNGKQFRKDELPEWVLRFLPGAFRGKCNKEVASLKAAKVGDSASTFYDVLNSTMSETVRILRNPIIRETLKSRSFETRFPLYWPLLDSRVRMADYRRTLIDEGIKVFGSLSQDCDQLLFELREKICIYLRNHELLVLIEACGLNAAKHATPPS